MIASYYGRYRLNIRKGANTSFPVVRTMEPGEKIEVISVDGEWARVREGYIMAQYLQFEAETHTPTGAVGQPDDDYLFTKMRVVELRELAEQRGIELKPNMKKADIIAAIQAR